LPSQLSFSSSDPVLNSGFAWAKAQALAYVFHSDALGDWYEAALPGRAAFCMRDVSHQATGAHLLGLARHTYNMLHRFAENITAQRDWCTYWEIDQHNQPCPEDYHDDSHFWYNLPANFDVLDCCWRQYQWCGNQDYLKDAVFRFFYNKSVNEYVRQWDQDGDGMLEHRPTHGFRGIATYDEQVAHPLIGGDLLAAQFAGYHAYAQLMALEMHEAEAAQFHKRAEEIRRIYDQTWWNQDGGFYHSYRDQDGVFVQGFHGPTNLYSLYFDLIQDPERIRQTLDQVSERVPLSNVEARSYLPETLFRYERIEAAYQEMSALFSPTLQRREYPEISFALIGALCSGLMGLTPQASERQISTLPRLPQSADWAEVAQVNFIDSTLSVRHEGRHASQLTLHTGGPLRWRAVFPGSHAGLVVDGQVMPAQPSLNWAGQPESAVMLPIQPGETHRVHTV
jgi:hypothetical protein